MFFFNDLLVLVFSGVDTGVMHDNHGPFWFDIDPFVGYIGGDAEAYVVVVSVDDGQLYFVDVDGGCFDVLVDRVDVVGRFVVRFVVEVAGTAVVGVGSENLVVSAVVVEPGSTVVGTGIGTGVVVGMVVGTGIGTGVVGTIDVVDNIGGVLGMGVAGVVGVVGVGDLQSPPVPTDEAVA